jgi:hypothetical protein
MAQGNVLNFPFQKAKREVSPLQLACQKPITPISTPMDSYDLEETLTLHEIVSSIRKRAQILERFLDNNRALARDAGIEMLVVQISSILEGDKFQRVADALDDAAAEKMPISLTREGSDKVHRLERLVAEADGIVVNFMGGRKIELGQASPIGDRSSNHISIWIPVLIIGVAGIVGVLALMAFTNKSQTP